MSVTLKYTKIDGSGGTETVSIKGPDLGNEDIQDRAQIVGETLGSALYVYTISDSTRDLVLSFPNLDNTERGDVERFFSETIVDFGRRWIELTFTPTWPVVIFAGATVSSATVRTGGGYHTSQRIVPGSVTYTCRLLTPRLSFREDLNNTHDLQLRFRILEGPLPANQ